MASGSTRWRSRSADRASRERPLAVYAMPSVIGAGRGDLVEVRQAAAVLRAAGFLVVPPPARRGGPPSAGAPEDGPDRWAGAPVPRRARRALTLSAQFGVTAEADRPGPLGRGGPWAPFVARLERSYGPGNVVHLSLEEFARNLPAEVLEQERWREGGRSSRWIRAQRRRPSWRRQVRTMAQLFRRFRALDRPDLLALFPTLRPSAAFRRAFPEAVECGPIYPFPPRRGRRRRARSARWLWYASPSTSELLRPGLEAGARRAGRRLVIEVRTDRPWPAAPPGAFVRYVRLPPLPAEAWGARFEGASCRIVTGGRSLLEALATGGPFLYFNGATGTGARRRRHRPEKLLAFLAAFRRAGVPRSLRKDLSDFAAVRRVPEIVAAALVDPAWAQGFPERPPDPGGPASRRDGAAVIVRIASDWARSTADAPAFVRVERRRLGASRAPRTFMDRAGVPDGDAGRVGDRPARPAIPRRRP